MSYSGRAKSYPISHSVIKITSEKQAVSIGVILLLLPIIILVISYIIIFRSYGIINWWHSLEWIWVTWDMVIGVSTVVALLIAVWQLRQNSKISGQTHAREAWSRYLEIGIQYPQYGSTKIALSCLGITSIGSLYEKESSESERYWWYLDIMLESCDSLVNYIPQSNWIETVRYNVSQHRDAIEYHWTDESKFYSSKLRILINEIIATDYPV